MDLAAIEPGTPARGSFEAGVRSDVAAALSISIERVSILAISAGSVVVDFSVMSTPFATGVSTESVTPALTASDIVEAFSLAAAHRMQPGKCGVVEAR